MSLVLVHKMQAMIGQYIFFYRNNCRGAASFNDKRNQRSGGGVGIGGAASG